MDNNIPQTLYPSIPPPPPSSKSYTFQPSAPPLARPLVSPSAPSTFPNIYPDLPNISPSAPPRPYDSVDREPWGSLSNNPTEVDIQTEPSYPFDAFRLPYDPSLNFDRSSSSGHQFSSPRLELNLGKLYPQISHPSEPLRALYENEYLKSLPERLASYENSFAIGSQEGYLRDFFEHIRSYESAHEAAQQSRLVIYGQQQKAMGYASKLWVVQTKSEVAKASCGDGATISHNYSYQYGHHEPEVAAKLKKSLGRLFKQRTKNHLRIQFEESSHQLWVQNHIASFLSNIKWTTNNSKMPTAWTSANRSDIATIRKYLDILFYFERTVRRQPDFNAEKEEQKAKNTPSNSPKPSSISTEDSVNPVLQSIRRWITLLAAALLKYSGFVDYEYLTIQTLCSRQVSDWAAGFVQCSVPEIWSSAFQNYYVIELELILCGSEISDLHSQSSSEVESKRSFNLGSELEEDDYLALLDQLDITLFFSRLLQEYEGMHNRDNSILQRGMSERLGLQLLTTTRRIFDTILRGIQRLKSFSSVSKRLSQLLCQLSQILGDHLLVLGPMAYNRQSIDINPATMLNRDTEISYQDEIDRILIDITRALLSLPGQGLWTFLPSIPFKFMSTPTLVLLLQEFALENIQEWIEDPSNLLSKSPKSIMLRDTLGNNPGEAVFLMSAIGVMATSRFSNNTTEQQNNNQPSFEKNIALVITYLLLDAAFMDNDIRGELMKPGREVLSTICDSYPGSISFILRFVENNFDEMESMAQYLFRGLPLEDWRVSRNDLVILQRLLGTSPLSSAHSQLARNILGSLSWNQNHSNESHFKIPDVFRKELAMSMAEICAHHLSSFRPEMESSQAENPTEYKAENLPASSIRIKSPDHKFVPSIASSLPHAITNLAANSGIHRSAEQVSMKTFMDWCWSMLEKLQLTEVPTLSLVEASRLHVQDPGLAKYQAFSQGQFTFINTVHLLLTQSSREAEQFLQEGWTVLTAIMQAGVGAVFLELARNLIIIAIDSEADSKLHAAKLGQLVRDMGSLKYDPMLSDTGAQFVINHKLSPGNTPKEQLGVWSLISKHVDHYEMLDGDPTKALKFWMSAIFSQKDWMSHQECVQTLNVICMYCFELGFDTIIKDALMEQQILLSIDFRRAPGISSELMGLAQPGLDRVMDMLPERFSKSIPVPQGSSDPSLLMGTWSVRSFATNLFTQQAMVETGSIWFAYYVLVIETSLEREMRIKIGNYFRQHPGEINTTNNIKSVMKTLGITSRKTLQNFAIWRWAQHLLILPFDTFLLPLYWQMFFYLYFGHDDTRDVYYGFKFLEVNPELIGQLRDRLQKTHIYFGQEARKAVNDLDPKRARPLTTLNEFYIALHGWISEPLLLSPGIDLKRIRKDLMSDRLVTCRLPDPLECNPELWKDLLVERKQPDLSPVSSPPCSSPKSPSLNFSPRSPTGNQGQARALRKHSHTWQEQKISNCLVKQAVDGPGYYTPNVIIQSTVIVNKSSPQSLFKKLTQVIKDHCKMYHAICQAYDNLDSSYLAELGELYHNVVKTTKLEIACDTTPNALCKGPASIELKYEEIVQNEQVKTSIIENRERARASKVGSVEQSLCVAVLEIYSIIELLLQDLRSSPNNTKLQELSIQSFYFLCKELLGDSCDYSPAQMTLTSIVDTLGMEIVAKDPAQTEPILDMMGTDDFTIQMIYKTFYPAAVPQQFVMLYKKVATRKEYGLISRDLLLRQFDVQTWACNTAGYEEDCKHDGPSILDRLAFYEVAFTAMVSQQQLQKQDAQIQEATELSTRDRLAIIKSHRELAGTLFLNFREQDYIEYLRILFNTCGIMCLEPEALEDYIRIMGVEPRLIPALLDGADILDDTGLTAKRNNAFTNVSLSDYDFERLVQFLSDYFKDCQQQMVRGNLLDQYSGYAISIASLLTVVLCDERYLNKWMKGADNLATIYRQQGINGGQPSPGRSRIVVPKQCRMWNDTLAIFEPWISCLTEYAVDENRFQRQQSGASRLLFTFVGIFSKMVGALRAHYSDISPMMGELYDLWLDMTHKSTLSNGGINQTMLIHQHFHRLEWNHFELSKERIDRTLEIAEELNEEIRVEFWTYLVTLVMEKTDSSMRPHGLSIQEWHVTESSFLRLGLTILQDLDLVTRSDMDLRTQFLDRLWATIFDAADWGLLSVQELKLHITSLKVHWDHTATWDDRTTPIGVLLYWMRIAVGLENTDLEDVDHENTNNSNNLVEERVLLYFEYVLTLMQIRLSSSAQDSQNFNFKLATIPFIILHLGQVLDRIAGSRSLEKHAAIHKPLLSLVGVLNYCGNKSSSSSPSSSHAHSFDVIQRGLAMMISEVEVIQLDIVRVLCQKINSISVMVNLLEEAIEREFDIWSGQQGLSSSSFSSSHSGSFSSSFGGTSAPMFGLEDTALQPEMSAPMPIMMGNSRSLHRRGPARDSEGRHSWSKIKSQLVTPELSEDEFLEQGLKQGAILTVYGQYLQELEDCEQSLDFDEVLALGQDLAEAISKVNLMAIEPWKAYQSLLLIRMFFNLVAKESVHSILQSRFLNSIKQVCRTLEIWYQDRDTTKGMLSSIGMGTRSCFDTKFRLVVRIIYTYVVVRLMDKGISIHQTSTQGGGMLAWRRARQASAQESLDGASARGSPSDSSNTNATNVKDASQGLVETLAQLPTKNKDYAIVFFPPPTTHNDNMAASTATSAPSSIGMSFGSIPKALAPSALPSSPLEFVKKSIMSSSPPMITPISLPQRPQSSVSLSSSSSSPTASPHSISKDRRNSQLSQNSKRYSIQSNHSRYSMGGSWDDTAGSILSFEEMSDPNGSPSASKGLLSTRRKFGVTTVPNTASAQTESRVRLKQGTKNGTQDLEWAVQQIKDRRFSILEAAEVLEEVIDRFYEGDDYFA